MFFRHAAVVALGVLLAVVPDQPVFGQEKSASSDLPKAIQAIVEGQKGMEKYQVLPDDDELTRLRKQQVRLRFAQVEIARARYQEGTEMIHVLQNAAMSLLESRMSLATSDDQRLEILQDLLELSRDIERDAIIRYEAGIFRDVDLSRATDARLAAEIELLELKQRQQQAGLNSQAAESLGQHWAMPVTGMSPTSGCAGDFPSPPARCFRPILRRW